MLPQKFASQCLDNFHTRLAFHEAKNTRVKSIPGGDVSVQCICCGLSDSNDVVNYARGWNNYRQESESDRSACALT